MPNYFMPAKDPEEVRTFFGDLVDQGKLKIVLATERPDVFNGITPTEEVRLIVDRSDATPPEGVDFDKVLPEFRPTPIPEDQLKSWSDEILPPSEEEEKPSSEDEAVVEIPTPTSDTQVDEDLSLVPETSTSDAGSGVLDKKWTPLTTRGFKG